jgi:hypothetical protein
MGEFFFMRQSKDDSRQASDCAPHTLTALFISSTALNMPRAGDLSDEVNAFFSPIIFKLREG